MTSRLKPIACLFALLTLFLSSCDSDSTNHDNNPLPPEPGKWEYVEDEDQMTSDKIRYATVKAEHNIYAHEPQKNWEEVYPKIELIHRNETNDVIISLKHLTNNTYDGVFYYTGDPHLMIRFDNEQPIKFSCSVTDDGNKSVLFINKASVFINKLKKAKQVLIQATVTVFPAEVVVSEMTATTTRQYNRNIASVKQYQPHQETEVMKFNVLGLKWEYCCKTKQNLIPKNTQKKSYANSKTIYCLPLKLFLHHLLQRKHFVA